MDYTQIIVSVLSLIVAVLTGVLVPYLKQKYGETKIAQTQQYVDIAVRAAEQLFKTEQAQEKKHMLSTICLSTVSSLIRLLLRT